LLKFLIFADLGLALGFGKQCNPKTDFHVGFGVGTGDLGVYFLWSLLFLNQCWWKSADSLQRSAFIWSCC